MFIARHAYRALRLEQLAEDLVFLDESGFNLAMTQRYAWAPVGQRAVSFAPRNWGDNLTFVAALTAMGDILAPLLLRGGMDAATFEQYVERMLAPSLRPGNIVLMDNLAAHKGPKVREHIEAVGAQLVFLPPYSPDMSPIEHAFSKIKAYLRKVGARSHDAVVTALAQIIGLITPQDAQGWFTDCGYPI